MFVDEARIVVQAGNGGKGCESFYRDRYTRYPVPNGGDGGKGGDVVFMASKSVHTLLDFRFKQHFKASKGGNASSNNKKGKDGEDYILKVPVGTIIRDYESGLLIKDLVEDKQTVIVAKGGRGGVGNYHKRKTIPLEKGEERTLELELKVMADVGLIGFPNVGKSTIISQISKVKSKIANYPFTTKQPVLGVVAVDEVSFVVADLPGLIEGAHQGKGLGDRFLRHAERTKMLVHVVDMAGSEGRDPLDDYKKINHELDEYSEAFEGKDRIVVANKMDLPQAENHLKRFKKKYKDIEILSVSALERKGLEKLVYAIKEKLCTGNSRVP